MRDASMSLLLGGVTLARPSAVRLAPDTLAKGYIIDAALTATAKDELGAARTQYGRRK